MAVPWLVNNFLRKFFPAADNPARFRVPFSGHRLVKSGDEKQHTGQTLSKSIFQGFSALPCIFLLRDPLFLSQPKAAHCLVSSDCINFRMPQFSFNERVPIRSTGFVVM
jgi:hypothetical protein